MGTLNETSKSTWFERDNKDFRPLNDVGTDRAGWCSQISFPYPVQ
jgi:hypothetical protein